MDKELDAHSRHTQCIPVNRQQKLATAGMRDRWAQPKRKKNKRLSKKATYGKMQSFTLLCNRVDCKLDLPIEVNEDYTIDKANDDEITFIKKESEKRIIESSPKYRENPFEMAELKEISVRKKDGSFKNLGNKTDKENWNYWIVRHNRQQIQWSIDILFGLIDSELVPIFDYVFQEVTIDGVTSIYPSGGGYTGYASNQIFDLGHTMKKVIIDEENILMLRKLIIAYQEIDLENDKYKFIAKCFKDYRALYLTFTS